jgi:hypothetical protein
VHGRQVLVAIAEMVLAELARGVAQFLEELRDRGIFGAQAESGAGQSDLGQPGANRRLSGDERRPARRAALLSVENR